MAWITRNRLRYAGKTDLYDGVDNVSGVYVFVGVWGIKPNVERSCFPPAIELFAADKMLPASAWARPCLK